MLPTSAQLVEKLVKRFLLRPHVSNPPHVKFDSKRCVCNDVAISDFSASTLRSNLGEFRIDSMGNNFKIERFRVQCPFYSFPHVSISPLLPYSPFRKNLYPPIRSTFVSPPLVDSCFSFSFLNVFTHFSFFFDRSIESFIQQKRF